MAGTPRSRFVSTTHSLRAVLPTALSMPEVERVVVNPVAEDLDDHSDRIHAMLSDGSLSWTTLVTGSGEIVVETLKSVHRYPAWDVELAAARFVAALRSELNPAVVEAAVSHVSSGGRSDPSMMQDRPSITPTTPARPKSRFRSTMTAVGIAHSRLSDFGLSDIVVNPAGIEPCEDEDVIMAVGPGGEPLEVRLYCGRDGSFADDGEAETRIADDAVAAFLARATAACAARAAP